MLNECVPFIHNLNIYDGHITYDSFEIDENLPFDQQVYEYRDDLLQIEFGPRFIKRQSQTSSATPLHFELKHEISVFIAGGASFTLLSKKSFECIN